MLKKLRQLNQHKSFRYISQIVIFELACLIMTIIFSHPQVHILVKFWIFKLQVNNQSFILNWLSISCIFASACAIILTFLLILINLLIVIIKLLTKGINALTKHLEGK